MNTIKLTQWDRPLQFVIGNEIRTITQFEFNWSLNIHKPSQNNLNRNIQKQQEWKPVRK